MILFRKLFYSLYLVTINLYWHNSSPKMKFEDKKYTVVLAFQIRHRNMRGILRPLEDSLLGGVFSAMEGMLLIQSSLINPYFPVHSSSTLNVLYPQENRKLFCFLFSMKCNLEGPNIRILLSQWPRDLKCVLVSTARTIKYCVRISLRACCPM